MMRQIAAAQFNAATKNAHPGNAQQKVPDGQPLLVPTDPPPAPESTYVPAFLRKKKKKKHRKRKAVASPVPLSTESTKKAKTQADPPSVAQIDPPSQARVEEEGNRPVSLDPATCERNKKRKKAKKKKKKKKKSDPAPTNQQVSNDAAFTSHGLDVLVKAVVISAVFDCGTDVQEPWMLSERVPLGDPLERAMAEDILKSAGLVRESYQRTKGEYIEAWARIILEKTGQKEHPVLELMRAMDKMRDVKVTSITSGKGPDPTDPWSQKVLPHDPKSTRKCLLLGPQDAEKGPCAVFSSPVGAEALRIPYVLNTIWFTIGTFVRERLKTASIEDEPTILSVWQEVAGEPFHSRPIEKWKTKKSLHEFPYLIHEVYGYLEIIRTVTDNLKRR